MTDTNPSSKTDVKPLKERLFEAQVASCSCLTKTPDISFHDPMCRYRLFQEAWLALEAINKVYDAFMIGSAVQTPATLLANVENARRRSDCLDAIEREFFTRTLEDGDGEAYDECSLSWGAEPAAYVEQFRAALTERGAVETAGRHEQAMALLRKYLDREYNPFEPNNQSTTYKELAEFLHPMQPLETAERRDPVRDSIAPNKFCEKCQRFYWLDQFDGHDCKPVKASGQQPIALYDCECTDACKGPMSIPENRRCRRQERRP